MSTQFLKLAKDELVNAAMVESVTLRAYGATEIKIAGEAEAREYFNEEGKRIWEEMCSLAIGARKNE